MTEGGHDGAWYCAETKTREVCPQQGCPKGFCARVSGWLPGLPEPDHYASQPAAQAGDLIETDPYSVVSEILEYFDNYTLATWAPVAAIITRERKTTAIYVRNSCFEKAAVLADHHANARRAASKLAKERKARIEARDYESMSIQAVQIACDIRAMIPEAIIE